MAGVLIILYFFAALGIGSLLYYAFVPMEFSAKNDFLSKVSDPQAISVGNILYGMIIASILVIVLGPVFINALQSMIRSRSQDQGYA